uniref:coiled-coil domain-containing protein 180-like n=1 Tax=Solea senegalensis TaxID=28829 RepID=UPI001CD8437B|nr:coiled-coil domain-containing protein 180-like [Solea senegalensis]
MDDNNVDDVSRLPSTVVSDYPRSGIIERLKEKNCKKHKEALKQLGVELAELANECETQIRAISEELLSFLQEVDLRLDTLTDRMEQPDDVTLPEMHDLWEQVKRDIKLKKVQVVETNHKLSYCETQRTNKVRTVLRKYCHLLEKNSYLLPPDIHRVIHSEAMMLNQSLLANRRSLARLLLLLQEGILQQESHSHLHWLNSLCCWKRCRITKIINNYRSLCNSGEDLQLIPTSFQQSSQSQQDLTEQRCDLISRMCSLVQPTCSITLVTDWFNQLTAINQQIESFYADVLYQLRCCYEQTWQQRLTEVEHCKVELSALQLSEVEVNDVIRSQLLPLIGQIQSQDEEKLAALDMCCDSVVHHALTLSRCAFDVMRGAALLWEMHNRRMERREDEVQQQLNNLRRSQLRHLKGKKMQLDYLLAKLRQESNDSALKKSLERAVLYLQEMKDSCGECVSDQCEVLESLQALFLSELLSYSSSLSCFFHLKHIYKPGHSELQQFDLKSTKFTGLAKIQTPEEVTDMYSNSCQNYVDSTQPFQNWLAEAESSLLDLYDIGRTIRFISSSGVMYTGPAFKCPTINLQDNPQQEAQLSLFPVELLTHTLNRTRTLFLDKLERHFHDVLSLTLTMVTERKEAVCWDLELQLQLLNPQHIQTDVHQPRLTELHLHCHCLDVHHGVVHDAVTLCRTELRELQTSISRKNDKFIVVLTKMMDNIMAANSSQQLRAASSSLQECLNQHIRYTQCRQTAFRKTFHTRLKDVRDKTAGLLSSFGLFNEGGEFAPQELKVCQRRLKEDTKRIKVTEQSIFSELEAFECKSLQQVKTLSDQVEKTLSLRTSEVIFSEEIEKIVSSTRIQIKAEAAGSNQHQSVISSKLEDLRRTLEDTHVSLDEVSCLVYSVGEDLRRRYHYLDFEQEDPPKSTNHTQSTPPPGLQQPSRPSTNVLNESVVDIIKFLNTFPLSQERSTATEDRDRACPPQRCTESVGARRAIRTDRRFQIFGPEPEQDPQCFMSTVNSVLWKTNDILLQSAESFYQCERHGMFQLLPDTLDLWAESMQQRLLGYQDQSMKLLEASREFLVTQQSVFNDLLHFLLIVLIRQHGQRREVEFIEMVHGVRKKLEEHLASSEKNKEVNVQQLRLSLRKEELQLVVSREEARQQQLHSTICCSHVELEDCVQACGEEFVTSLAVLTEKLLSLLDDVLTPVKQQESESIVTMERTPTLEQEQGETESNTWPGIPYLSPPSSCEPATTASITTTRSSMDHVTVIEQRDNAVRRFEQLLTSELLCSDVGKQKRLKEIELWTKHWREQMHTLIHINTQTHTSTC